MNVSHAHSFHLSTMRPAILPTLSPTSDEHIFLPRRLVTTCTYIAESDHNRINEFGASIYMSAWMLMCLKEITTEYMSLVRAYMLDALGPKKCTLSSSLF